MISGPFFYYRKLLTLIIVLLAGGLSHAQDRTQEAAYINNKLQQVDSLIDIGEYDKANYQINNTLNTFSFARNSDDRLAFEFRIGRMYYQQGQKEKAMQKLLNGLDRLKGSSNATLQIDFANLLARIFADSQNFDKAIYYNKISLDRAKLSKDTVGITKALIRLGSFYYAKNEEDSAKIFFRKVTYYPVTPKTEIRISNAYNNLGVIAQNNNNFLWPHHTGLQNDINYPNLHWSKLFPRYRSV